MTKEEEKEVIRVCGPNYEKTDIPAFIRNRDVLVEEGRQEEKEKEEKERLKNTI